jgi:hypothetical protein
MTWATRNIGAARAGIAIFVLFLQGIILAALFVVEIPVTNKDIVLLVVGGLTTLSGTIGGYYFGVTTRRGSSGA